MHNTTKHEVEEPIESYMQCPEITTVCFNFDPHSPLGRFPL